MEHSAIPKGARGKRKKGYSGFPILGAGMGI
jgi:hypothetical protein